MQDIDQRIANKRQKPIVIELSFEKISKNSETSKKRLQILPVYIKERLTL